MILNKELYGGGERGLKLLRSVYYDADTDRKVDSNRTAAVDAVIATYGECIALIRFQSGNFHQYIIQSNASNAYRITEFYDSCCLRWDRVNNTWYKRGTVSGTTNVSGVTWKQRDRVVEVDIFGVSASVATSIEITGLPKPISSELLFTIKGNTGISIIGYCQYHGNRWIIYFPTTTSSSNFCNFTYLTDDFE